MTPRTPEADPTWSETLAAMATFERAQPLRIFRGDKWPGKLEEQLSYIFRRRKEEWKSTCATK